MKIKSLFIVVLLLFFVSAPASAITAGELLEEEDSKHIGNYLAGLADMFAYMQFVDGNKKRGKCVYEWYYQTEGTVEKIHGYLTKYPDKIPEAIFIVLAKRACPK